MREEAYVTIQKKVEFEHMLRFPSMKRPMSNWGFGGAVLVATLAAYGVGDVLMRARAADTQCRAAPHCLSAGYCSARSGSWKLVPDDAALVSCQATSDIDCANSEVCRLVGDCHVRDGKCVASRDEDCSALSQCKTLGQCRAVSGECAVRDDADCRRTSFCASIGWCSARNGKCVAASDADCLASENCLRSTAHGVVVGCKADGLGGCE